MTNYSRAGGENLENGNDNHVWVISNIQVHNIDLSTQFNELSQLSSHRGLNYAKLNIRGKHLMMSFTGMGHFDIVLFCSYLHLPSLHSIYQVPNDGISCDLPHLQFCTSLNQHLSAFPYIFIVFYLKLQFLFQYFLFTFSLKKS